MSQTSTSNSVTAEPTLEKNIEALIKETSEYEEKSLWDQLEDAESGNKTWYQKFGNRAMNIKEELIEKVKDIKINFSQFIDTTMKPAQIVLSEGAKGVVINPPKKVKDDEKSVWRMNILTAVVRRVQSVVHDHGHALEFIREIFNMHDDKIKILEEKVRVEPSDIQDYLDTAVKDEVDAKQKEYDTKLKDVEKLMEEFKVKTVQLEKSNEKLEMEIEETRQRGMKGNLLISCPPLTHGGLSKAIKRPTESLPQMCSRLIQEKTGVHIPISEIKACHVVSKTKNTYLVKVDNMAPRSGWEALAAGMMCGKRQDGGYFVKGDGIFLNFQLTAARAFTLKQVRLARQQQKIHKFSVNQNGVIKILKVKPPQPQGTQPLNEPWLEVKSMEHLKSLLPLVSFPLTPETRDAGGAFGGARSRR